MIKIRKISRTRRNSLHLAKVIFIKLLTLFANKFVPGALTLNLILAIYLLNNSDDLIVHWQSITTIVVAFWLLFDRLAYYVESKRSYSRLAALRLNGGTHTDQQWQYLLRRFNYRCCKCQQEPTRDNPITKDHIIPVSLGGTDNISNIQPLCKSCNSAKGNKIVDYR